MKEDINKNNKIDVLFLCQYFYPEYVSSATLPFDTAVGLAKAGFTVEALCGYPKEYSLVEKIPLKEIKEKVNISRLKYIQLKRSNVFGRLTNYLSFTFAVALNFRELRKYKSVIVYSNPPVLPLIAAFAHKCFGTKVVFVSYDVYPEIAQITNSISKNSMISKMMNMINKILFTHLYKVVALSNEMKTYLLEHRQALNEHQIEVIPNWYEDNNGVHNEKDSLCNPLFTSLKKEEDFVVSYFGNMGIAQDIDTIIDAIRQLKENNKVQFIFAGHGNKMKALKNIVKKESLNNVTIFDFLHGKDFQDALSISDCFLVSLAEGLTGLCVPSKTYSYMMMGKPIIAIMEDSSDIAMDLEENKAGFTIQVGESHKLVSAIITLFDNVDKRKIMGKRCRKIFLEKYTKEHCTQKYIGLIKKAMEEK